MNESAISMSGDGSAGHLLLSRFCLVAATSQDGNAQATRHCAGRNMASGTYNAESITVLEGLEAVRRRPGMYIGGVDKAGLHHLLWEIVDNSVDEVMNGHATRIVVTLEADGKTISVADNGRGIPVDIHPKTGQSALEVIFTTLHAGRQVRQRRLQGRRRPARRRRQRGQRPEQEPGRRRSAATA